MAKTGDSLAEPFCKWVGGKTQLLSELMRHVPKHFEAYHEPMVGGGALFWALHRNGCLHGKRAYLADTNPALIECYEAIRDEPERLVKSLEQIKEVYAQDGGDLYYRIRDAWNEGYTSPARFIFLKQTSFNGLWRQNRRGKVNMAWGKYENPKILDADRIFACSKALQLATLRCAGFEETVSDVKTDDVVFYDPPYWGRFDLYGPDGFSVEQHNELLKICGRMTFNGTYVIYTNEHGPEMAKMLNDHWPQAKMELAGSRRFINRDGKGREPVSDMIAHGPVTSRRKE